MAQKMPPKVRIHSNRNSLGICQRCLAALSKCNFRATPGQLLLFWSPKSAASIFPPGHSTRVARNDFHGPAGTRCQKEQDLEKLEDNEDSSTNYPEQNDEIAHGAMASDAKFREVLWLSHLHHNLLLGPSNKPDRVGAVEEHAAFLAGAWKSFQRVLYQLQEACYKVLMRRLTMRATIGLLEGGFRVLYSNLAPGSPLIPHNFNEATGTRCFTKFIPKTKGIEPKTPVLTSSSSYPRLLREASLPNPGRAAEKLPVGHAHATMTVAGEPTINLHLRSSRARPR